MTIKFNSEAEFEAAIAERIATEVAKATAKPAKENGADWSAYADFPDLVEALKATDLRPASLSANCVLKVCCGHSSASALATSLDMKVPVVTRALKTAEAAFLLANMGFGIKVETKRGNRVSGAGNSYVKIIKFHPWREMIDNPAAEEQLAA